MGRARGPEESLNADENQKSTTDLKLHKNALPPNFGVDPLIHKNPSLRSLFTTDLDGGGGGNRTLE